VLKLSRHASGRRQLEVWS